MFSSVIQPWPHRCQAVFFLSDTAMTILMPGLLVLSDTAMAASVPGCVSHSVTHSHACLSALPCSPSATKKNNLPRKVVDYPILGTFKIQLSCLGGAFARKGWAR